MRRRQFIAVLLWPALLGGCMVRTPGGGIDPSLAGGDPTRTGLVIGSFGVGRRDTTFSQSALLIRAVGAAKPAAAVELLTVFDDFPPNYRDDRIDATIFAIRLPAGRYEIYNYTLFQRGPFGGTTYSARQDFSLAFSVEPGRATYVGEYFVRPDTGRTGFGVATTQGAIFAVGEQRARDLNFARQQWPDFDFSTVIGAVPDPDALRHPLFVRAGAGS
jgi:hypothetical protein